ncbi:N-acetyltransferase [Microbacterium protaetiae]|uniref:N-acetyltransferase n=1 Tax=Microbacterium protaetiae TaxID=2509458 RepID=A0A4P6EES1_9MICO|nr:GNAT family N-acetyltransferase [Microbacterium protaetiae]QAY59599.1 N-acetyltransferase [Microbacterium protaetiae]
MRFRPLTPADLESSPEWFGEIELRADRWRGDDTRSAVALDEAGATVAAGILWTSRAHDDRYWADIVVEPSRRRRGIGSAMAAHLATLRHRDIPFMTRGFVGTERLAFAFARGARTIQVVPPTRVATARRQALRPLATVAAAATLPFERVLAAHADMYEWIHRGWSLVSAEFASAISEGLDDDLDQEASAVAVGADGQILALVAVYRDSDPYVVCAETTRPEVPHGERIVEGCLRYALDALAARGIAEVDFDGHVTDPHLLPNWVKLGPAGEWFLLVEIVP